MQKIILLTFVLACFFCLCFSESIYTNVTETDNGVKVNKVGYTNCSIVFYAANANQTFIRVETNSSCANGGSNKTVVTVNNGTNTVVTVTNNTQNNTAVFLQGSVISVFAAAVASAFFIVA